MSEQTIFAPVYIPTLNRYEHFKRCLESLEHCSGADQTDVYVGLDYPPSDKYVEGWKKLDAYLAEKEQSNGFRNLFVRRRYHNCGIGKPGSNGSLLLEEIKKVSDRYIVSEDDNEFSPNFLIYMNKMLERFKDDDRVCCVCGYGRRMDLPNDCDYNYYLANDYVAWGVGFWKNKKRPAKYNSYDYLKHILQDKDKYELLQKRDPNAIRIIVNMLKSYKLPGDALINLYEALEYKYSIMPTLSKVRNHGNDGTGVHSLKKISNFNDYFSSQPIDEAADFDLLNEPIVKETNTTIPDPMPLWKRIIKNTIFRFDLFLIRHFGIVPHCKYI